MTIEINRLEKETMSQKRYLYNNYYWADLEMITRLQMELD